MSRIKIEIDKEVRECDRLEYRFPKDNPGITFISDRGGFLTLKDCSHISSARLCLITDPAPEPSEKDVIRLTKSEIQNGLDRVRWAELLIKQLPETHEGRNTWLKNFGRDPFDDTIQVSEPSEWERFSNGCPLKADGGNCAWRGWALDELRNCASGCCPLWWVKEFMR